MAHTLSKKDLMKVRPNVLMLYLKATGWKIEREVPDKDLIYFSHLFTKEGEVHPVEVMVITVTDKYSDYALRIAEILDIISEVEKRPLSDIYFDLCLIPSECPVCGKENDMELSVKKSPLAPWYFQRVAETHNLIYEGNIEPPNWEVLEVVVRCNHCTESFGITTTDIKRYHALEKEAITGLVKGILKRGITKAYLARALRIPIFTVNGWEKGHAFGADLALLQFIHRFPWMLQVADTNFNEESTDLILESFCKRTLKKKEDAQNV